MNEQEYETPQNAPVRTQSLAIPIAIIVGFGFIAAAIYFSGSGGGGTVPTVNLTNEVGTEDAVDKPSPKALNPVTEEDHIRGNPNAPIMIVEYSDYDCPFCKSYHETMNLIMDEYGPGGKVAWVYRHFPLEQLHPSAPRLAEASECIAQIGGNDAFWTFTDLVFDEREVNELTNMSRLDEFAQKAGVDTTAFNTCLTNGDGRPGVVEDFNNGVAIGARGTPHSIIVVGDERGVINGAQPYSSVKQQIDNILVQLEG